MKNAIRNSKQFCQISELFSMKNLCKIWPLYILLSSGVKSVDKREGSGSHNWGTYEDDIKADQDQVNTSTDETGQTTGMKSTINIKL